MGLGGPITGGAGLVGGVVAKSKGAARRRRAKTAGEVVKHVAFTRV